MSDEAVRKEFEAWKKSLPKCVGYAGGCDGDLMGLEHETNCPMHGKEFASYWDAFSGGFASGRSAAIQECADLVFNALLAEAANLADKRDLFEFLQVTADNLRNGVLALKER